jgi:hypothetical protein
MLHVEREGREFAITKGHVFDLVGFGFEDWLAEGYYEAGAAFYWGGIWVGKPPEDLKRYLEHVHYKVT